MTTLYDPEQVERLINTADRLRGELDAHKVQLKITDTRSKNARFAAILGAIAATVGVTVAIIGISFGQKANDTSDKVKDLQAQTAIESTEIRTSACIQYNVQRAEVRVAVKSSLSALVPPGATLTAEQKALLDAYNAAVDKGLPYRDCSVAGIVAYYKTPPADPAIPR